MNQRIKELACEARLLTGWPVGEVEYQKFAELIIKDCEQVLKNWKDEPFPFDEDLAVTLIKDHFGVR